MSYFSNNADDYTVYALSEYITANKTEKTVKKNNLNIILLPPIHTFSITSPSKTLKSIRQINYYIKKYNIDFVHILFATPYSIWINYINKPSIITTRGSDILVVLPSLINQNGLKGIYKNWLFNQFKRSFSIAKIITSTSQIQAEKINSILIKRDINIIRTGVDVDIIKLYDKSELIPASLKNKEFVFSPRFMSPIYNISFQIDAISILDAEFIERFTFVFIRGKQFDANYYQAQLKRLEYLKNEINLNYLIVDYLDQPTIWMFLKKASLCMMTPISDGTPNSALEAMAAKCPLIVSNLNYDSDLFDNTCIKLKSFEVAEFKDVIECALTKYNPELLMNAFKQVSKFGNRNVEMKKLEQLYNLIAK